MSDREADPATERRPPEGDHGPRADRARVGVVDRVRRAQPSLAAELGQFWPYVAASTATFLGCSLFGYVLLGPTFVDGASLATGPPKSALDYFLHNGLVAGGLVGGFGVLTLGMLAFNGVRLGVAVYVGLAKGLAPETVVALIAPHGVVEIPALLLAGGLGLFLAHRVTAWKLGRREEIVSAREEVRLYAAVALVYLGIAVAAVIEAHLTPRL